MGLLPLGEGTLWGRSGEEEGPFIIETEPLRLDREGHQREAHISVTASSIQKRSQVSSAAAVKFPRRLFHVDEEKVLGGGDLQ